MTIHTTPNYGLAYCDSDTALKDLATASQQLAQTVDTALGHGGVAPYDVTSLAAEVGARQALDGRVTVVEQRVTAAMTAPNTINGGAATALTWGSTSARSTAGMWASAAPTRLKPPAAGEYDLSVMVSWTLSTSAGALLVGYRLNGSAPTWVDARPSQVYYDSAGQSATCRGITLAATDYLEVVVLQNTDPSRVVKSGSTVTLSRAR